MTERRKLPLKTIALGLAGLAAVGAILVRVLLFPQQVEVVMPTQGAVREEVKGPGSVSSEAEVAVSSRITGVVEHVLVQEGDQVKQGQLLAALDERDLAARAASARSSVGAARQNVAVAEAGLEKAQADLMLARNNYTRDEAVFRAGHLAQAALDIATASLRVAESAEKNARAVLGAREQETRRAGDEGRYADTLQTHAQITAPLGGLVTLRQVEVGNTVAPGNTLFRVVDDQNVSVATRIDVSQMGRIQLGQPATIRLASGPTATGSVARISHEADPVTRDQEVRVRFATPPAHLTLNEEAEVVIGLGEVRGLVIPGGALLPSEGADAVLVARAGRVERVVVQVGARGQGKVLIRSGLEASDQVLAHPAKVEPGQRVRPRAGKE
jgi:HlyD family secretion protein